MNIKIQVIATTTETKPTTKGSYQLLEVTYKDLDKNKVASKKVMSFAKPESVFKNLATAKGGDVYDIELVKNEQTGYWDWTLATKSSGATGAGGADGSQTTLGTKSTASATTTTKGGWETPSERAAKQVMIVRQSSLSNAIATLVHARKGDLRPEEVVAVAKLYEEFVLGASQEAVTASVKKDLGTIEELEEDPIPF